MRKASVDVENLSMSEAALSSPSCWSCAQKVSDPLVCDACGVLQPVYTQNLFDYFGIAASFKVDLEDLEKLYFEVQKRVHPDRFLGKSHLEKGYSAEHAALANRAYETFKCPLKRAHHLLEIKKMSSLEKNGQTIQDPDLLMEMMEKRERLANTTTVHEVNALITEGKRDQDLCLEVLGAAFANEDYAQALQYTHRLKYLMNFLEEAQTKRLGLKE